jgi:hypothetical protein
LVHSPPEGLADDGVVDRSVGGGGNSRVHIGNNYNQSEDTCLADLRSTDPRDDKTRSKFHLLSSIFPRAEEVSESGKRIS